MGKRSNDDMAPEDTELRSSCQGRTVAAKAENACEQGATLSDGEERSLTWKQSLTSGTVISSDSMADVERLEVQERDA